MKTSKLYYLRFFVAGFSLWLSVVSFTVAFASAIQNPHLLTAFAQNNTEYTFQKEPKWLQDFEIQIDKSNTLSLSYSDNGFAQDLRKESKIQRNAALASETLALSEKSVLPVKMEIPDLGKILKVDNPQTTKISELNKGLKKAVLRYPGTARLDEKNRNMLIFGHSSHLPTDMVFNKMYRAFNGIEKLKKGALIKVHGDDGKIYVFKVTAITKKKATDSDKINIATSKKMLTLVTCDNFGAKEDRWVVEAEFAYKN